MTEKGSVKRMAIPPVCKGYGHRRPGRSKDHEDQEKLWLCPAAEGTQTFSGPDRTQMSHCQSLRGLPAPVPFLRKAAGI